MREEMRKANLPEPEFEILRGTFKVTFRKENNQMSATDCTDNEINLLRLLAEKPNITQIEISKTLNISRRTVSTLLKKLKDNKKIERIASDRKGYWKVL